MTFKRGFWIVTALIAGAAASAPAHAQGWYNDRGYVTPYNAYDFYQPSYDRRGPRSYVRIAPPRYEGPVYRHGRTEAYAVEGRRRVQRQLNALGFDTGPPDGVYGELTRRAMADFQASIGVPATGRLNARQIEILFQSRPGYNPYVTEAIPGGPDQGSATDEQVAAGSPVYTTDGLPADQTDTGSTSDAPIGSTETDDPSEQDDDVIYLAQAGQPTLDDEDVRRRAPGSAVPFPRPGSDSAIESFRDPQDRPKVFDVTVGTSKEEAKASLARNGYRDCKDIGETMACSSENRSMTDAITVAFAGKQEGNPVYLIRRTLSFKDPIQREFLVRQMTARYPELLAAPDMTISAGDTCRTEMGLVPGAEKDDPLDTLVLNRRAGGALNDATLDLIDACPDFYALAFDGQDKVSHLDIVVFSSNTMRQEHSAELNRRRNERDTTVRF